MPAQNLENFKRECIIRGSSEIIITENGDAVLYKVSDNCKFMTSNIFAARIMEYAPPIVFLFCGYRRQQASAFECARRGLSNRRFLYRTDCDGST